MSLLLSLLKSYWPQVAAFIGAVALGFMAEMSMRSGHMAYFLNARRLMGVHFDGAIG